MAYSTPQGPNSDAFLWDAFQKADIDKRGSISAAQLQSVFSNGAWTPFSLETLRLLVAMFDKRDQGRLGFEEFCSLHRYVAQWRDVFYSYDEDNSGSIDKSEFAKMLIQNGYRLSPSTINTVIRKYDRRGDGTILLDDFIQCYVLLDSLTDCFKGCDTDHDGMIAVQYEHFLNMLFSARI